MKVPSIAYATPVIRYDADARVTVLQYRDADSGKVTRQFPGELAVKAYRSEAVAPNDEPSPAPPATAASTAPPKPPTISLKA